MTTIRTKRWNGKIDTLNADYLKDVIRQMETYGDLIQFSLASAKQGQSYQVTNTAGKKMAFDGNHHLLHPEAGEFVGSNATAVFTLAQVTTAMAGGSIKSSAGTRTTRVSSTSSTSSASSRGSTAAERAKELVDTERYAYYKNNRQTLPPAIGEHSEEISALMKNGMSVEDAFGEVIKRHF